MTAKLPEGNVSRIDGHGIIRDKKEFARGYKVVAYKGDTAPMEVVDCRLYWDKNGSQCHCLLWLAGCSLYLDGYGKAGGWGYDKESTAVSSAIKSAGITLSDSIAGVGLDAVREALLAIGRELTKDQGYSVFLVAMHA